MKTKDNNNKKDSMIVNLGATAAVLSVFIITLVLGVAAIHESDFVMKLMGLFFTVTSMIKLTQYEEIYEDIKRNSRNWNS